MENKYFSHHICLASVLLLLHLLVNMPVTLIIDTQRWPVIVSFTLKRS